MELEEGEIPRVRSFRSEGKEVSLPRGRWRVGLLHGKKKFLFLRFATKGEIPARADVVVGKLLFSSLPHSVISSCH